MKMKNKIVYIGNFIYPDGNAAGKRVASNAKLLNYLGFQVSFIGKKSPNLDKENESKIYEINIEKKSVVTQLTSNAKVFEKVKEYINTLDLDTISAVILYGELTNASLNLKIINWLKKEKVKVLVDCVEWWQEKDGNYIYRLIKNLNTSLLMKYVNKKSDGIIAISKFLSNYYSESGLKTIVLPPLVENKFSKIKKDNKNFQFIYAGSPFRLGISNMSSDAMKDRLDSAIEILIKLKKIIPNIKFDIYGITKNQYTYSVPKHENLLEKHKEWIIFHGGVSNKELQNIIAHANVTLLIRDENLVTRAGFSTKLAESLSLGTPVITTSIGDVSTYVKENITGLVLPIGKSYDYYSEKIADYLVNQRISGCEDQATPFDVFFYKNYKTDMRKFLIEIGILEK